MSPIISKPPYDRELVAAQEAQIAAVARFDPALAEQMRQPYSISLEHLPAIRPSARERAAVDKAKQDERLVELGISHSDHAFPGLDGAPDVTVAVFRPREQRPDAPAIFWIHGGGMMFGDRFGLEVGLLDWAAEYGMVIASVEYRLAPENPFPRPLDDVYAGLTGFLSAHTGFGVDPQRVILAGGSAGGTLAAGAALRARDTDGPRLAGQLLICPMLDDRNDTLSSCQFSRFGPWDRESNQTAWTAFVGFAAGTDEVSQYAAPARATDLSGLPPTFIDVGSAEVFRDEDLAYASAIWAAGGDAELHVWPGGYHGFHAAVPDAAISRGANRAREEWVRRILDLS